MTERKPRPGTWNERYATTDPETMPWFHPDLDPEIERALAQWIEGSAVILDLGTGPGTQAIELARRGHRVTGTDVAPAAIDKATARAARHGVEVAFAVDDVLKSSLDQHFDLVIDRGCFHVFEPPQRPAYARTAAALVEPGGLIFLKTFSHLQPGDMGPQRVRPEEVEACFGPAFEVLSTEHCVYQGNNDPLPKALFFVLRRRATTGA